MRPLPPANLSRVVSVTLIYSARRGSHFLNTRSVTTAEDERTALAANSTNG
jgi:hypothetical protein